MTEKNILKGEMAKYGITFADLARVVGVSPSTISSKLNGKSEFTLGEARKIVALFNGKGENHTVESIFFNTVSGKAN